MVHRYRINLRVLLEQIKDALGEAVEDEEVLLEARLVAVLRVEGPDVAHQAGEELLVGDMRSGRAFSRVLEQVPDDLRITTFQHFCHDNLIEREVAGRRRLVPIICFYELLQGHFALIAEQLEKFVKDLVDHDPFEFGLLLSFLRFFLASLLAVLAFLLGS